MITRNSTKPHRVDTHWSQLVLSRRPQDRHRQNHRPRYRIDWVNVGWWIIPGVCAIAVAVLILVLGPLDVRPM